MDGGDAFIALLGIIISVIDSIVATSGDLVSRVDYRPALADSFRRVVLHLG